MPDSKNVASVSSGIPFLPADIVIELLAVADWKDVLSARQASTLWCTLSKMREVWKSLILRETQPTCDRPALHYLTRPIHDYTTAELEQLLKQWKVSEKVLRGEHQDAFDWQWSLLFPKTIQGTQALQIKYTMLLPGGRWLVIFDDGPNAVVFDLDAENPVPQVILTKEHGQSIKRAGRPCIQCDVTAPGTFLISLPLCDQSSAPARWTVDILLLEVISNHHGAAGSETLRATIRTTLGLNLPRFATALPRPRFVVVSSLTSSTIALRIVGYWDYECITLIKWSDLPHRPNVHFPRTTISSAHECLKLILVPNDPDLLIVLGRDRAYVLDFNIFPVQTSFNIPPMPFGVMPIYFPISAGLGHICSEPYFLLAPQSAPGHLRIRIMATARSDTSMLLAMEFDIGPRTPGTSDGEVSASYSLLSLPRFERSAMSAPVGYSYALVHCTGDDTCSMHRLDDIWTSLRTGIPQLKASTRGATFSVKGQILQIDEGTGRCVSLESNDLVHSPFISLTITDIAW